MNRVYQEPSRVTRVDLVLRFPYLRFIGPLVMCRGNDCMYRIFDTYRRVGFLVLLHLLRFSFFFLLFLSSPVPRSICTGPLSAISSSSSPPPPGGSVFSSSKPSSPRGGCWGTFSPWGRCWGGDVLGSVFVYFSARLTVIFGFWF